MNAEKGKVEKLKKTNSEHFLLSLLVDCTRKRPTFNLVVKQQDQTKKKDRKLKKQKNFSN